MKHAEDFLKAKTITLPKGKRTIYLDAFDMWYYSKWKWHPTSSVLMALKEFVEGEK